MLGGSCLFVGAIAVEGCAFLGAELLSSVLLKLLLQVKTILVSLLSVGRERAAWLIFGGDNSSTALVHTHVLDVGRPDGVGLQTSQLGGLSRVGVVLLGG